jgi:hypothetical protein
MSGNRQIGWSQESNLLYNILKKLERLTSIIGNSSPIIPSQIDKLQITPNQGVSSFSISGLNGRTVYGASRSGLSKGITSSSTNDTQMLQILNGVCYLPIGDLTQSNELFIFDVK